MLSLMAATERQFLDFKSLNTEMKAALRQRRDKQKEAKESTKRLTFTTCTLYKQRSVFCLLRLQCHTRELPANFRIPLESCDRPPEINGHQRYAPDLSFTPRTFPHIFINIIELAFTKFSSAR